MAHLRNKNGKLVIDFYYKKKRYKVYLKLDDTPKNRKFASLKLAELERELTQVELGIKDEADLAKIFPNDKKFQKTENLLTENSNESISENKEIFTLNEAFEKFLLSKIHVSKNSIRTWKSFYNTHFKPYIGYKKVNEIFEDDIIAIIKNMQKTIKNSVINKKIMCVKSLFKNLKEDNIIEKDPFRNIKPLKAVRPEINPFTQEELKKLLEGFRKYYPHYYNFVAFLAFTGCRPNEAVALKWKYIDWENRKILIREGFVLGETTTLKTSSSRRDIDMTDNLFLLLKHQYQRTHEINKEYVFINQIGKRICWENFRQKYHKVIKKLKIPSRPIYQLRHTFASLALKAGEDPTWVSRTLGHSSLKTTLEIYNRYIPSLNQDGRQINSIFSKLINNNDDDKKEIPFKILKL